MRRTGYIFLLAVFLLFSFPVQALELAGELKQGALITGRTTPGTKVTFEGTVLPLTENGTFIFGFDRDYPETAHITLIYPDGTTESKTLHIEQRTYDIQHIDGLPGKMVSPPEGVWDRIAKDRTAVANARNHKTGQAYFLNGFLWPAEGPISGVYGSRRILNGKPKQPHYGVDVAAPEGTPVYAPADGIIRLSHPDMYYTGKTVILDHGHGLTSTLMHMSALNVKEGQMVKQGNLIGAIGSTGRVTGPHLDWRMNWLDAHIDPMTVVTKRE